MRNLYLTLVTIFIAVTSFATTPAPIGGSFQVCVGNTTVLTDATPGGTWASSSTIVATVGSATGIVTGMSAGMAIITYTIAGGGFVTQAVTVNTNPAPITGVFQICIGGTTNLTDASGGGIWSSSFPAVASISSGGAVTGLTAGTTSITYVFAATGCAATATVTVNPLPSPITGTSSMCVGGYDTLTSLSSGGTWSTSSTNVSISGGGILAGISAGIATITYTLPTGCSATTTITVNSTVSPIAGTPGVCPGGTTTLTDATGGGVWSSSNIAVGTVVPATGVTGGITPGTTVISYTLPSGCTSTVVFTVSPVPAAPTITGDTFYCPCVTFVPFSATGSSILWYTAATGGTGSSTAPTVNTCITGTTTFWASQTTGGCESSRASITVTVASAPAVTASSSSNCGGTYNITAGGAGTGATYVWAPTTALSCYACTSATVDTVYGTITYTVTGTNASGCTNTNTVTLNGNRISGFITMTTTPTDTLKVWLIQFNPIDSSLTAQDSVFTCMDGSIPYYEFDSKPAGNYLVKAKLLGSVPGTSGYVPTYGLSSAHWDTATTVVHASATDTQHINMIYGTVPSGPGFIGGLISAGAGRGTSGVVPAVGMLVYLEDASGTILTYTYTNSTGHYAFSGLGYGTYIVYPVDYHYHTTPWVTIVLTSSSDSSTTINFYEHLTHGTITPTGATIITPTATATQLYIYPNPATNMLNISWTNEKTGDATIAITDITGREVYRSLLNISAENGAAQINVHGLDNGMYFITIRSHSIDYNNKLLIRQ